jgi:hypothetical protein
LDLLDHFSQSQLSSLSVKDETYDKIVNHLDESIKNLTQEDKQLISQTLSKCYFKYQDSIKAKGTSGFELKMGLLMAILLDQQLQIDKLTKKIESVDNN